MTTRTTENQDGDTSSMQVLTTRSGSAANPYAIDNDQTQRDPLKLMWCGVGGAAILFLIVASVVLWQSNARANKESALVAEVERMQQRESVRSHAKTCRATLRQLEAAKEQWAMDNRMGTAAVPTMADLCGDDKYIRTLYPCPGGGTLVLGAMFHQPRCSVGDPGTPSDPEDDHAIP